MRQEIPERVRSLMCSRNSVGKITGGTSKNVLEHAFVSLSIS